MKNMLLMKFTVQFCTTVDMRRHFIHTKINKLLFSKISTAQQTLDAVNLTRVVTMIITNGRACKDDN